MLLTHLRARHHSWEQATIAHVSPSKHPAVRYRVPKTPGTTVHLAYRSTHITCRISRAINNSHRNRGSNVCRRRRNRFRREERNGGAVQSLLRHTHLRHPPPAYELTRPRTCCSRRCFTLQNCRAFRRVFLCRRLEEKETARGAGFRPREVAQVPAFRQADTYLSKCLHAELVLQ